MEFSERKLISEYDSLELSVKYVIPEGKVKGIVQISHGMTEHKDFLHQMAMPRSSTTTGAMEPA